MSETQARISNIIFDEPAKTDGFEGGGHERSAKALSEAIDQLATHKRDGAIGLEGRWGAGKSTVIELAKELLGHANTHKNKYSLFTFDLWSHQTDEFRRAFLEAFITWLGNEKLIDSDRVESARDAVRDRVKEVTTKSAKRYNVYGIVFLLAAPFIPLLYTWLSPFAFNMNAKKMPNVFGVDVTSMMWGVLAILYLVVAWRLIQEFRTGADNYKHWQKYGVLGKLERSGSRAMSMLSRDAEHETTTQNIRETDPTTIEFHRLFRELLAEVQKGNHRVIFVLDNIDRLAREHVPDAWSEIRALFSNELPDGEIENAHVTAVVPYDKAYVLATFVKSNENANGNDATGILDKTFVRTLRVAPPIGTDWKQFIYYCIERVFGKETIDRDTSFRLFKILERHFQIKVVYPTPRTIIKYVNEVGSLWSQWGDLIDVDSLALYALHKEEIEKDSSALKNAGLVSDHYLHVAHARNWQRNFAALAFNVHPDIANQVFLDTRIAHSLIDTDGREELQEISELDAFPERLLDVLAQNLSQWASENGDIIAVVASHLEALALKGQVKLDAWRAMARAVLQIRDFDISEFNLDHGLLAILRNQQSRNVARTASSLIQKISNACKVDEETQAFEIGQIWLQAIDVVRQVVEESRDDKTALEVVTGIEVPEGTLICLGIMRGCVDSKSINFSQFRIPSASQTELRKALKGLIDSSPTDFLVMINEVFTGLLKEPSVRAQYLEPIATRLRTVQLTEADDKNALLNAFVRLYGGAIGNPTAKTVADTVTSDGTILWRGAEAEEINDKVSLANCLWLLTTHFETQKNPAIQDQHPAFKALAAAKTWYSTRLSTGTLNATELDTIAANIEQADQFSKWMSYAIEDDQENGFFRTVFSRIVERKRFQRLDVARIATEYEQLRGLLGADLSKALLVKYAEWKGHFEESFTKEVCFKIPDVFIEDVSSLESSVATKDVLKLLDKHLKGLSQTEWQEAFQGETDALRLLVKRQETGGISIPVKAFQPALLSYVADILDKQAAPEVFVEEWDAVVGALPSASRSKFPSEVVRKLRSTSVTQQGAENFVFCFGSVVQKMPFGDDPDLVLDQLLSKLVYSALESSRAVFKSRTQDVKRVIKNAGSDSVENFGEAVASLEDGEDEGGKKWAIEVRRLLGLKKKDAPSRKEDAKPERKGSD